MDNNEKKFPSDLQNSMRTKGTLTSESFKTYEKIQNPKLKINFGKIMLCLALISVLSLSAYVIISSTSKTSTKDSKETEDLDQKIKTVRTVSENNDSFKVEQFPPDIASVYNCPPGVKIVEINNETGLYKDLLIGDIITEAAGEKITCIEDINKVFETYDKEQSELSITVYRKGAYKKFSLYEE